MTDTSDALVRIRTTSQPLPVTLASPTESGLAIDSVSSKRSRRSNTHLIAVSTVIQDEIVSSTIPYQSFFVTLTYADEDGWSPDHMSSFTNCLRKWCSRRSIPFKYIWVLEFDDHIRPHYHLLLWLPTEVGRPPVRDWWNHGISELERTRSVPAAVRYLAKRPPPPSRRLQRARWYGHGGLTLPAHELVRYLKAPKWLRNRVPEGTKIRRRGAWWVINDHFILRSPWRPSECVSCLRSSGPTVEVAPGRSITWVGWTEDDVRLLVPGSLAAVAAHYKLDGLYDPEQGLAALS